MAFIFSRKQMTFTLDQVKLLLRPVPDFPKKGIMFQDIFPIFENPQATKCLVKHLTAHIQSLGEVDCIVGLDSRGFLLGPWIAAELGCAFVPVRKAGKLPPPTFKVSYVLEYGTV
jgi:adenine phosphoribosyltransferase